MGWRVRYGGLGVRWDAGIGSDTNLELAMNSAKLEHPHHGHWQMLRLRAFLPSEKLAAQI